MRDSAPTTRPPAPRPAATPGGSLSVPSDRTAHHWPCGSGPPGRYRHRAGSRRTPTACDPITSTTSALRMSARGSVRLSPKISAIGPRAHAITAGTSSATVIRASGPSTASAARSVKPMPRPPINRCGALDRFDLSAGERRKRLLRSAEAAVHQFVRAQHHREFGAPSHQTKFDVGAGHACRIDLQPGNHAMLLRCFTPPIPASGYRRRSRSPARKWSGRAGCT